MSAHPDQRGALSATSIDETNAELAADMKVERESMSALLLAIRQRIQPLPTLPLTMANGGHPHYLSRQRLQDAAGCSRIVMARFDHAPQLGGQRRQFALLGFHLCQMRSCHAIDLLA